jgi:hypothetical protein
VARNWSRFSYQIKTKAGTINALDAPGLPEPKFNESQMSATGLLATRQRDRVGDIFEVAGLDTSDHQRNPIVLLDHGQYYPLPIGKTVDPDGQYTVVIDEKTGDCYQTTYFSQHSQVAEQVYHLYVEGILRANSIGYQELRVAPVDPARGIKAGKHILKSKLVECTWCGIPVNPDAVTATLSRDKICGKSICPEIKTMLQPYILPKRVWVSVPTLPKEHMETKNKADEPRDVDTEIPADQPGEQEVEVKAEPLGKTVLSTMSADMKDMAEQYGKAIEAVEHEKVKKLVAKHIEAIKAMCGKMDELHDQEYAGKSEDGEESKDDGDADDKADEKPEPKDEEKPKDEKDDEGDGEKNWRSQAMKAFTKALDEIISTKSAHADEEKLTPAEEREVAALERAIQRRLDLVSRLA